MGYLIIAVAVLVLVGGGYFIFGRSKKSDNRLDGGGEGELDPSMQQFMEGLSKLASPVTEEEQGRIRLKLIQAGYTTKHSVETYNAMRVGLSIGVPVFVVPLFLGADSSLTYIIMGVLVAATFGYFVPQGLLDGRVRARQKLIMAPFSDALDLLVTSVEAGLGLDAALRRVADELQTTAPVLAGELRLVNQQSSAGVPRIDALKQLALRTGLDEIKSLVNMLAQSERFGTSIARGLRIYSDITRQKRMARAEEEAAGVSPKLTVVMILCLMPCLAMVLLGPSFIRLFRIYVEM